MFFSMVRNYVRKTLRASANNDIQHIQSAIYGVTVENRSLRSVAQQFGINHVTLRRYVLKSQASTADSASFGYTKPKQVFSAEQEQSISDYLKRAVSI